MAPAEGLHLAEVAEAVGLREGARGVEEVLRQIHRLGAPPARMLSRRSGLPVPIVVAICGELRRRGLVDRRRPSHLTPMGRELASRLGTAGGVACTCAGCSGSGIALSQAFATARRRLEELLRGAPPAEPRLDQAHSTVDAKLRRVAYMEEVGALVGRSVLMLGDDDFIALALAVASSVVGIELPERLVVLDVDAAVIGFTRTRLIELGVTAELVEHDLRSQTSWCPPSSRLSRILPIPAPAPNSSCREPPTPCARGQGGQVLLSFGPKSPDESAALQHSITGMGLPSIA